MNIAFICTANVCRSVMAHAILESIAERQNLDIRVFSAGVMDFDETPPAEAAWITCLQHETPIRKPGSTFIEKLDVADMDWLLVMEQSHLKQVESSVRGMPVKVRLLGEYDPDPGESRIADPIGMGLAAFEDCYVRIERCIRSFLEQEAPASGGNGSAPVQCKCSVRPSRPLLP